MIFFLQLLETVAWKCWNQLYLWPEVVGRSNPEIWVANESLKPHSFQNLKILKISHFANFRDRVVLKTSKLQETLGTFSSSYGTEMLRFPEGSFKFLS